LNRSRRLELSSGVVVSVLLLGLALPAAGQVRVSTVQEAVDRWTPETHLYVLGDVGLGDATLAEKREQRAADRKSFFSVLSVVLLGVLATAGWSLNRRRQSIKAEAEALLASSQAAGRRLEALFGDLQWRADRLIEREFAGETAELARQVREDLASLAALGPSARVVMEQAAERIRPRLYNLFFSGGYSVGLALLRDEGLMQEMQERTARAAGTLDELETSLRELPLLVEKTHERIWQAGLQKDYLAEAGADGLFLVPTLFSELLPAATAALDSAQETADADPVGTWKGEAARGERMAADAWRLAGLCRGVRSAVMPALQSTEPWIEEGLRSLSSRAADLASRSAKEAVTEKIETLAADLAELPDLAGRLIETRSRIAAAESRVESFRVEIGTALGLAPDLLLRETSEKLSAAALQAAETEALLRRGEVGAATAALESAGRMASEAEAFLETSRKTFEERETAIAGRRAETERLAALLPGHEAILAGLRKAYAESALGAVADLLDEAQREIDAARAQLDLAADGIRKGRLLAAASLLGQVRARQEQAGAHLAEIVESRARLDRAREDNLQVLAELEARAGRMGPELSLDPGITQRTLAVFEEAAGRIRTVREWIDAGREDPLRAGEELLAARNELDRVETTLAPEDRRLHEEALRRRREEEEEDRRRAERRRRSTASSFSSSSSSSSSRPSGPSRSSGSRRSGSGKSRW